MMQIWRRKSRAFSLSWPFHSVQLIFFFIRSKVAFWNILFHLLCTHFYWILDFRRVHSYKMIKHKHNYDLMTCVNYSRQLINSPEMKSSRREKSSIVCFMSSDLWTTGVCFTQYVILLHTACQTGCSRALIGCVAKAKPLSPIIWVTRWHKWLSNE